MSYRQDEAGDERVRVVMDVLAPMQEPFVDLWGEARPEHRVPIFEWGHETTPTDEEVRELAEKIVAALEAAGFYVGRLRPVASYMKPDGASWDHVFCKVDP